MDVGFGDRRVLYPVGIICRAKAGFVLGVLLFVIAGVCFWVLVFGLGDGW
jgi:hypothetical protein